MSQKQPQQQSQSDTPDEQTDSQQYQDTLVGKSPVVDTTLILKKYNTGGHKTVVDSFPDEDNDTTITEKTAKDPTPQPDVIVPPGLEYPRQRDHYTVSQYKVRKGDPSRSYRLKVFDITINREDHPDTTDHYTDVISQLNSISDLNDKLRKIDSYKAAVENADLIRTYERRYDMLQLIWNKDVIDEYVTRNPTPRQFEINQFSQGFFGIPHLYADCINRLIDKKFVNEDIGHDSVAWGSFITGPQHFSKAYKILKHFYEVPDKYK
jgi:hypothetical protein